MEVSASLAVAAAAATADAAADDAAGWATWNLATKLGANHQNALGADQAAAIHLAAHRWAWFAGADPTWRALFESHVRRRLDEHVDEQIKNEDDGGVEGYLDGWFGEVWSLLHGALWVDPYPLKKRAAELFQGGIHRCREMYATPPAALPANLPANLSANLPANLPAKPPRSNTRPAFHRTCAPRSHPPLPLPSPLMLTTPPTPPANRQRQAP